MTVRNISKRYQLGQKENHHQLREKMANVVGRSIRALRSRSGNGSSAPRADNESELWALRDVSFDVGQGEVLGVIGRNGAGKSTLLKILSRITDPTGGKIELYGRVGSLLEVGTGFHPELTGRENIFLNGAILGMKRAEIGAKFDEIVDFSGIERFIDTPVKRYSSGMYVRLAFAVAAHLQPEILLVDEVLAVGDADFQKKCLGKMGEIGREGRTVLMVSHNLPSVVNLCRRGILIDQGRVELSGTASEVVERYLASATSSGGEVVWPDLATAPGNDVVRLLAVRVWQGETDGPTGDVDISKDTFIGLTFKNLRSNARLLPGLWVRDQLGSIVFATNNLQSISATRDPWEGKSYPPGTFRSVCRIPGNFLNEGVYSITVIIALDITQSGIFKEDSLSFHVHDTGEMRKEFFGSWPGTVKVRLAWHTDRVDSALA
jgi:lipopolysaccharide transport system ATP-binding protein